MKAPQADAVTAGIAAGSNSGVVGGKALASAGAMSWWAFLFQLTSNPNFMWFSLLTLVQTFHCHFNSNFFPLFLATLLGDHLSPLMLSALLGISFVVSTTFVPLFSSGSCPQSFSRVGSQTAFQIIAPIDYRVR
jgi:hypothetical protein